MRNHILSALAILTTGSDSKNTFLARPLRPLRKVECADGTTFELGDEVTDVIACQGHGGLKARQSPDDQISDA